MQAEAPNRTIAALRLANNVPLCMVEVWIGMLAVKLLDLSLHPERAQTHALCLRWAVVPVISPREYREGTVPRKRLNAAGQQQHMLALKNYTTSTFEAISGPKGQSGSDVKAALLRLTDEDRLLALKKGEFAPISVAVFNLVDPEYGGVDGTVSMRCTTIREKVLALTKDTEVKEYSTLALPGEELEAYLMRCSPRPSPHASFADCLQEFSTR